MPKGSERPPSRPARKIKRDSDAAARKHFPLTGFKTSQQKRIEKSFIRRIRKTEKTLRDLRTKQRKQHEAFKRKKNK